MSLLLSLFAETAESNIPLKHLHEINKKCQRLQGVESIIPELTYPKEGTDKFNNDIKEVQRSMSDQVLGSSFLDMTNNSVKKTFKAFAQENNLPKIDWDYVEVLLDEVSSIVMRLKYKYNRKRPKFYLYSKNIKKAKSPSFPSGHTAIAYFLTNVLSHELPSVSEDLNTLAEVIGQSRIENGVHFPTDVEYGKLVGQIIADFYNNKLANKNIFSTKNKQTFKSFLRLQHDNDDSVIYEIAHFIKKSNQIDKKYIDYNECIDVLREFVSGYPIDYIEADINIKNYLSILNESYKLGKIDSVNKILHLHSKIKSSKIKNTFRNYNLISNKGIVYSEHQNIFKNLKNSCKYINDPFLKNILYEYVHPFNEFSSLIGRVILCSDFKFNFSKVNEIIDNQYEFNINYHLLNSRVARML